MMLAMLALLGAMLPWLMGTTLAANVALRSAWSPGAGFVLAGAGGILGYLLLALAVYLADLAGFSLFSLPFVLCLGAATLCSAVFMLAALRKAAFSFDRRLVWPLVLFSLYACWLAAAHLLLPVQSWDVLGSWGYQAVDFIAHTTGPLEASFEPFWKKHPLTLYLVIAWSSWLSSFSDAGLGALVPWLLCAYSMALIAGGYAWYRSRSPVVALLAALSLVSLPLLENHILLPGYGELFLAAALVSACALMALAMAERSAVLLALGMVSACSAAYLKNTGVAYAAIPLAAWAVALLFVHSRKALLALIVIFGASVYWVWQSGIAVDVGPVVLSFDADVKALRFGGHRLVLDLPGWSTYFSTELTSRLLNQSFQVAFLVFALAWAASPLALQRERTDQKLYLFLLLACTFVFVLLSLSLLTDYGLRYATPGADTGHSRFSLPAFALLPLILGELLYLLMGPSGTGPVVARATPVEAFADPVSR